MCSRRQLLGALRCPLPRLSLFVHIVAPGLLVLPPHLLSFPTFFAAVCTFLLGLVFLLLQVNLWNIFFLSLLILYLAE